MTAPRDHWENVYRTNDPERVGWYQATPNLSLEMLRQCAADLDAPIIDVGGGCSYLVDHLLDDGHTDLTVLDMSVAALGIARHRLGARADLVEWIEGDVTSYAFDRTYQIWHDRAAFHFLTDESPQDRYLETMGRTVAIGGDVVMATFALDGPERCSGLQVQRYGEETLAGRLGEAFEPVAFNREIHVTPGGVEQRFLFGRFRRVS